MNSEIVKKFNVEKFDRKLLLNKPADIADFEEIAFDEEINAENYDLIFAFVFSLDEFKNLLQKTIDKNLLNIGGIIYFAYPKKGNKRYDRYLGRDELWDSTDGEGYVNGTSVKFNKMAAFDEVFTVAGFKHEEKRKKSTSPSQCVGDYVERIPDIRKRFAKNIETLSVFDALTPGYRRDWARYVFSAKNVATVEKRFEEMENILKQGYKSRDLYMRDKKNDNR